MRAFEVYETIFSKMMGIKNMINPVLSAVENDIVIFLRCGYVVFG